MEIHAREPTDLLSWVAATWRMYPGREQACTKTGMYQQGGVGVGAQKALQNSAGRCCLA